MKPPQYYSRFAQTHATQGGNLPHWSQWCATFTTFRLADSLPEGRLEQLRAERDEWLHAHGIDPYSRGREDPYSRGRGVSPRQNEDTPTPIRRGETPRPQGGLEQRPPQENNSAGPFRRGETPRPKEPQPLEMRHRLSAAELSEYRELFPKRFHAWLDAGHGSCVLGDPHARASVEAAIRHFADVRYSLYGFVVKPNHVHVLFMPEEGFDSRRIVADWKRFTAHEINRMLGRDGILWQKESYDRLVRDVDQFNVYRAYIRQNDPALAYDAYAVGL